MDIGGNRTEREFGGFTSKTNESHPRKEHFQWWSPSWIIFSDIPKGEFKKDWVSKWGITGAKRKFSALLKTWPMSTYEGGKQFLSDDFFLLPIFEWYFQPQYKNYSSRRCLSFFAILTSVFSEYDNSKLDKWCPVIWSVIDFISLWIKTAPNFLSQDRISDQR